MTEIMQLSLIALIAFGHVKLYLDTGVHPAPLSPVEYRNRRAPYGFTALWIDGKFVSYIDLR